MTRKRMTRKERQAQISTGNAQLRVAAGATAVLQSLTPYGAYERIVRSGIVLPSSKRRVNPKKEAFHRVLHACSREEIRTMARALKRGQEQEAAALLAQAVEAYAE